MKNKIIIMFFSLMLILTSCGKKESVEKIATNSDAERQEITDTQEITTEADTNVEPDEKRMASDIDSFGGNTINFPSGVSYTLKTESVSIEKASKEEKQIVAYCDAVQSNEQFNAKNKYKLTYNFYEIGGWVLDECTVEKLDMTPKQIKSKDEVEAYLSMQYTSAEYISDEKIDDLNYVYHYQARVEHAYMDEVSDIDVNCTFDNDLGWQMDAFVTSSWNDWSKMYGTWYGTDIDGSTEYTFSITVKDVDQTLGTVTTDIVFTKSGYGFDEGVNEVVKNDVISYIQIEDYSLRNEVGIEYETDIEFYTSYIGDKPWVEDVEVWFGKDIGLDSLFYSNSVAPQLYRID